MVKASLVAALLLSSIAAPAGAVHGTVESDYPGSWAIADGHGAVVVKVQYLPQSTCWRIRDVRQGVPDAAAMQPTGRHLYVTVALEHTDLPCLAINNPLETRLTIPDRPETIDVDLFFVDDRGVLQGSQRHRIERTCGASTTTAC